MFLCMKLSFIAVYFLSSYLIFLSFIFSLCEVFIKCFYAQHSAWHVSCAQRNAIFKIVCCIFICILLELPILNFKLHKVKKITCLVLLYSNNCQVLKPHTEKENVMSFAVWNNISTIRISIYF